MMCRIFIKKGDLLKLNIGILYGGKSVEHEVSILTALQVYKAIDKEKYKVELFYITKNNEIIISSDLVNIEKYKTKEFKNKAEIFFYQKNNNLYYSEIGKKIKKPKMIDSFVVCVHGNNVEAGIISSILDFYNAAYTCSENTESGILQDKEYTKVLLNYYGIKTLPYKTYTIDSLNDLKEDFYLPCIIKPARLGSSIGINIVDQFENFENGLKSAFKFENKVIVEPLIKDFREFNCACCRDHNELIISTIEEIKNIHSILTYEDKYQNKQIKKDVPALITKELSMEIKDLTRKIYQLFNLKGIVRVDFIYKDNELFVNEVNNIPGSLAYYLFTKEGISFAKLLDIQIKQSILNKQNRIFFDTEHTEILSKNNLNNIKK